MKLTVLTKKVFELTYTAPEVGIFLFPPYGTFCAHFSGKVLHKLYPTQSLGTLPLPDFQEVAVIGTPFQAQVWQFLLNLQPNEIVCYSDVADAIGRPKAHRAVGSAVGANPIGVLIPCHRVLAKNGGIGGFAWGIELKKHWLKLESTNPK